MTDLKIELNYQPLGVEDINIPQEGMTIGTTPATNTPATPVSKSNIVDSGDGSVVNLGAIKSSNFATGIAGWRLDSNGNIEANDGNFRGDITGSSGTFTGTITATGGNIGGWSINATSIYTGTEDHSGYTANAGDLTIYSDGTDASIHGKEFYIAADGKLTCTSITATGTINAQAGYLSAGVYIDAADGIVCESGGFDVGVSGHIRGGSTDYNTGTGWWIGYDTTAYKLSIGNPADATKLMLWDGTDLIVNGSTISMNPLYGDGSDGNGTIDDGGTTALTADKYYNNLTISNSSTLQPAGYRIFVKGVLTIASGSKIERNGNVGGNGSAGANADGSYHGSAGVGAAGAALSAGIFSATLPGKAGTADASAQTGDSYAGTAGTNGDAETYATGVAGVGGGGGGGGGGAGGWGTKANGAASTGGAVTLTTTMPRNYILAMNMLDFTQAGYTKMTSSASSGSGGGGGAGAGDGGYSGTGGGGGGSGSPGGIMFIAARFLVNAGSISADGGAGGNGGNGGAGGLNRGGSGGGGAAGGAGGGTIVLVYGNKSGAGTITVAGGAAGSVGAAGAIGSGSSLAGLIGLAGTAGTAGLLIELQA